MAIIERSVLLRREEIAMAHLVRSISGTIKRRGERLYPRALAPSLTRLLAFGPYAAQWLHVIKPALLPRCPCQWRRGGGNERDIE